MSAIDTRPQDRLLVTNGAGREFREALRDLFDGDGTVYLVSGYFTYMGYLAIRDKIVEFLERDRNNRLVAIVGPASDQFSGRIASDLWKLDDHDQVELYKQPRGLHAKLYLRDGPNPRCIMGSANITQVALEYNIELSVEMIRDRPDHPDLDPYRIWLEEMLESSSPLLRRDLLGPVQVASSFVNWSNKARLLPKRNVALRVAPVLVLLIAFSVISRLI